MLNQMLVSDLKQFGLSEYESRVYLILNMYGSSIASFVSEHTRIPSSKVYDILNSLKMKGLVEVCSMKPKMFRAVDPKHALSSIVDSKENLAKQLRAKADDVLKRLKPIKEEDLPQIWSSNGRNMFCNKLAELFKNSKGSVMVVTTDFTRNPQSDKEFLSAISKGVRIRMIGSSGLPEESRVRAEWYARNGASMKILPMDIKSAFALGDSDELVFKMSPNVECDFIWSKNAMLVNIMKMYFEHLWARSEIIQLC